MSNSRVLFEFRGDASNIKKSLNELDERLVHTSEKAENIGQSFNQAGKMSKQSGKMMAAGSAQATTAVTGLNWIISDTPYFFQNARMGIMAVSNNITPLVNNMAYLQKETGNMKNAMKALGKQLVGPMGIVFAITTAIAVVQALSFVIGKHKRKTEGATESNKEFAKSLEEINKSVNIDALESQLDKSADLIKITEHRIASLEKENEQYKQNEERIKELHKASMGIGFAYDDNGLIMSIEETRAELNRIKKDFKEMNPDAEIKKLTPKSIQKYYEKAIDSNKDLIEQEKIKNKERRNQIKANEEIGNQSKKEERFNKRLFEYQTAQLSVEEQIAAWEKRKAEFIKNATEDEKESVEYKETILEYDQNINKAIEEKTKLEKELSELRQKNLSDDQKIAVMQAHLNEIDRSTLEGKKEAIALEKEIAEIRADNEMARQEAAKKYRLLQADIDSESKEYIKNQIQRIQEEVNAAKDGTEEKKKLELELYNFRIKLWNLEEEERKYQQKQEELYRERLADNIASGGLERLYEDIFTNIKEKFIRYWLERIGIDRAMMNLEESIVRLSTVKLDILKEGSHQKEMNRQVKEGAAAATNAGMKGTESASGLPFPANIAAIALVLASVFSAIRKSKITGQRVMAAAEGAIINKPTLLLAGEALSRSGTEIVMPEKNFNKYMERDIIPGIMAKVNIDNSGLREELRQVRSAIFAIGDQIPGETGKAVKRALRGKF